MPRQPIISIEPYKTSTSLGTGRSRQCLHHVSAAHGKWACRWHEGGGGGGGGDLALRHQTLDAFFKKDGVMVWGGVVGWGGVANICLSPPQ